MTVEGLATYAEAVQLHRNQRLEEAEAAYRRVLQLQPAHADCLHQLGALLIQKGGAAQYPEALRLVKAAIQLAPANARYRRSLGVVHEAAQRWLPAAEAYERAIEKRRNDVQAHMDLARVLKAADRHSRAAEVYRAVVDLRPDHPTAHYKLASILRQMGKHKAAVEEYREQLRLSPDHSSAAFWLSALTRDASASACPPALVARLFDSYSDHFDQHLLDKLGYRTPDALMECVWGVARAGAAAEVALNNAGGLPPWGRCIDLGCGTGLMGPLLRPHVRHLAGVDLSGGMVDKARARGCYDQLHVAELTAHLAAQRASCEPPHDLLVAADVFVYLGDLAPVLAAAAAVAADGALFAFSTERLGSDGTDDGPPIGSSCPEEQQQEAADAARRAGSSSSSGGGSGGGLSGAAGDIELSSMAARQPGREGDRDKGGDEGCPPEGYMLQPTGRYAHCAAYLRRVAADCGWAVQLVRASHIRHNAGEPIWGHLCVLRRL